MYEAFVEAGVELLDAPVLASFKGQGVVSGDDDRFVGVTGNDLPPGGVGVSALALVLTASDEHPLGEVPTVVRARRDTHAYHPSQ